MISIRASAHQLEEAGCGDVFGPERLDGEGNHVRNQIRILAPERVDPNSLLGANDDRIAAPTVLVDLSDLRSDTHLIDVVEGGILDLWVPLGDENDLARVFHGGVDGGDRARPPYVQGHHRAGEDHVGSGGDGGIAGTKLFFAHERLFRLIHTILASASASRGRSRAILARRACADSKKSTLAEEA